MGIDSSLLVNEQAVPADLFCPVCHDLVHPADAFVTPCAHLFCRPCIARSLSTNSLSCPSCMTPLQSSQLKPVKDANRIVYRILNRCAVRCEYASSGCEWQGELSDLHGHVERCENQPVICEYCGERVTKRDKARHDQICVNASLRLLKAEVVRVRRSLKLQPTASLEEEVKKIVARERDARDLADTETTRRVAAEARLRAQLDVEMRLRTQLEEEQRRVEQAQVVSYHYRGVGELRHLGLFLAQNMHSCPPYLDRSRLFICIQRCVQDAARRILCKELFIDVWFALSAAYNCDWFTDKQKARILLWMKEHHNENVNFSNDDAGTDNEFDFLYD